MTTPKGASSGPVVTIGVPVYNGERYLRETLDTLVAQDYGNIEIIISDNASTDGTQAICQDFAERYPTVVYKRNAENIGAWRNFNQLPDMGIGKYFLWAGAHDLWHPTFVRRCVDVLETEPKVVAAFSFGAMVDTEGRVLPSPLDRLDTRGLPTLARYLKILWETIICLPVHSVFRMEPLRRSQRFRTDVWGADHLFLAEMSLQGEFAQVPESLFSLRDPHGAQTAEERQKRIASAVEPSQAERLAAAAHGKLWRDTCLAHLQLVRRSTALSLPQKARALLATVVGFHIRFLIPMTGLGPLDHALSVAIHRSRVRRLLS